MRRVLCIWFPNWPLQRLLAVRRDLRGRPLVLFNPAGRRGAEVVTCSSAAFARGVRAGMPLAEATALVEGDSRFAAPQREARRSERHSSAEQLPAHLEPHDPEADVAALRAVARRCRVFSPLVALEETESPESLLLDITGCAHLFGDERGMTEHIARQLRRWRLLPRLSVADTVGAAWGIAHYAPLVDSFSRAPTGSAPFELVHDSSAVQNSALPVGARLNGEGASSIVIIPAGAHAMALRPLPIAALRLPSAVVATLQELGIETIEQLEGLPRASLPARFGTVVSERLDQALGVRAELIVPERPPEPIEARWPFEEPTGSRGVLERVLRELIEQIVPALVVRQEGVLRLLFRLECPGHEGVEFTVGLVRPSAAARHLSELATMQLERLALPGPVGEVSLKATSTAPLGSRQRDFFGGDPARDRAQSFELLVNRLSSRLGPAAVLRARLHPDAQPECAVRYEPVVGREEGSRRQEAGGRKKKGKGRVALAAEKVRRAYRFLTSPLAPKPHASSLESASSGDSRFSIFDPRSSPPPDFSRPLRLASQPVPTRVTAVVPDGPPVRFEWKGRDHLIARSWGPERVETGWWRGRSICRDYYRVETRDGRRFWLFRERRSGGWFVQGGYG